MGGLGRLIKPSTIAIDGPAASGKSTIGGLLAQRLGYLYLDTGVMYRAVTWVALERGVDIADERAITALAETIKIDVTGPTVEDGRQYTVYADGQDITWEIRRPEVDANVSPVSAYPGVRVALTKQQRRIGRRGRIVMIGRDIGTVVVPRADLKIYLDASVEERARRRYREIRDRGELADYEEVLRAMRRRDKIDSERKAAPLKPAPDAVIVDTEELSVAQVLARVMELVECRPQRVKESGCGVIASVKEGSIAAELGWRPGDALISINGHRLRDVIDYRFYGAEEELEVVLQRDGERIVYEIERGYDEELGVKFTQPTFDGLRRCTNRCQFCFINGLPPGMRPPLYIKDDDYRYSFLFGNFITLTNLTDDDWERLVEQRLSPLYISVHTSDHALRRRILGCDIPDIMDQLRRLASLGIQIHTQIVLIPGLNDGPALARTVSDLAALHPAIHSIAIVPVGLTRYHRGGYRPYNPQEAGPLIDRISGWQRSYRRQHGLNLVYASDEWYLLAGRDVPPADDYDGFPQLENGVGLTRLWLDGWDEVSSTHPSCGSCIPAARGKRKVTLVCGTLIAPIMREIGAELADLSGASVEVTPVVNRFFGPTVTVSGLLTGGDVIEALRDRNAGDLVLLSRAMLDEAGKVTLDDLSPSDIESALNVSVKIVDTPEALLRAL